MGRARFVSVLLGQLSCPHRARSAGRFAEGDRSPRRSPRSLSSAPLASLAFVMLCRPPWRPPTAPSSTRRRLVVELAAPEPPPSFPSSLRSPNRSDFSACTARTRSLSVLRVTLSVGGAELDRYSFLPSFLPALIHSPVSTRVRVSQDVIIVDRGRALAGGRAHLA